MDYKNQPTELDKLIEEVKIELIEKEKRNASRMGQNGS